MFALKSRWTFIEYDGGGDAWLVELDQNRRGSMDCLHLLWDIVSVWAICAGCLSIFIAVLKVQNRD